MSRQKIQIKSSNKFLTRRLVIEPEILGKKHYYEFASCTILLKIPGIEQVDRDVGSDVVASVGARRAVDNEPAEYDIHKVEVEVSFPIEIEIHSSVLDLAPNAYDIITQKEKKQFNKVALKHQLIAERAFVYWVRVVRWICDDSRIGRDQVQGFRSGWSTYLIDTENDKKVWIKEPVLTLPGYKKLTMNDWSKIESSLNQGLQPPIFLELKHEAEERIRLGDYRRALIDLAVACEVYMRRAVANSFSGEFDTEQSNYIGEASIRQFIEKYFPNILDTTATIEFANLKSNLHSLFDRRNKVLHLGEDQEIDHKTCLIFLQIAAKLFSLSTKLAG